MEVEEKDQSISVASARLAAGTGTTPAGATRRRTGRLDVAPFARHASGIGRNCANWPVSMNCRMASQRTPPQWSCRWARPSRQRQIPNRRKPAGTEHGILSLTQEVDPGDRQLGDLLRSLELVDADTLAALLLEARRQRRSLRQLLLAGNYLTLYRIALIEAGNLHGLVLGPVRVIDRLQGTPREAVYRVFDPRQSGGAASPPGRVGNVRCRAAR